MTRLGLFTYLAILCTAFFSNSILANTPLSEVTVVKLHYDNHNDNHHTYHYQLIHQIMEVTRDEFGEYRITSDKIASTEMRQAELISKGESLNLHWAPPNSTLAKSNVIQISIDILFGIQGHRVCLINRYSSSPFSAQNLSELQQLKIGQGYSWPDLLIYQQNNIKTVTAPGLYNLYQMLGSQRFDCLPLGVNEVMTLWDEAKTEYPFLSIEPDILIQYDFPIYFYVSKKEPMLAKRIEKGLQQLTASGELQTLFSTYFLSSLKELNLSKRKLICLKSNTAAKISCQPTLHFLSNSTNDLTH